MECTSSKLTVVNSYVLSLMCRPSQIPTEVHISQWMLRLGGVGVVPIGLRYTDSEGSRSQLQGQS